MLTQAPLAYSSGGSLSVASVANAVFDSASADAVDELLNKALYLFTPKQLQKALALVDQASSLSVFACVSSSRLRSSGRRDLRGGRGEPQDTVSSALRSSLSCVALLLTPGQVKGHKPGEVYTCFPGHFCSCHAFLFDVVSKGGALSVRSLAKGWPLLTVLRSASTCWPRSSRVRWSGAAWWW